MASAITVAGVAKQYGKVVALRGIDLDVPPGSILGLVGPNGAGKTTLIRILVGALQADAGSVRVLDLDPFTERRSVRAHLGYMPQSAVLYQDLTVQENVTFFARGHLLDGLTEKVAKILDFVDLAAESDRPVQNLSGGMQQRVSMAAALVHEPTVVFLDEPTAGVDPELRHAFWQRFRLLAGTGVTLVISTHQMDEVVHCDRVALIRKGRLLTDTTPAELFASGGGTVRVVANGQVTAHRVESVADDLPKLLRADGLDPNVTRIEVVGPTLEELILGMIGEVEQDNHERK